MQKVKELTENENILGLVHRFRNNHTTHLSANPIGIVIYETMYLERGK